MPEDEQDLRALYRGLGDSELEVMARNRGGLTDQAQRVLDGELSSRGMRILANEPEVARGKPRRFVTIRSYRDLSEAIVARSMLESAGVEALLRDENLIRLDWQVSNMIGGVRLQVPEADAAGAGTAGPRSAGCDRVR